MLYRIFLLLLISFATLQANIRMGIVSASHYCGERELAWRMKIAGERLGWEVIVDEDEGQSIQNRSDLDFVVCLLPDNPYFNSHCPNYLTLFHPHDFLNKERALNPMYEKYHGYLLTIHERESLAKPFLQKGRSFYFMPFYPTVHRVEYKRVDLHNLVTSIAAWGNRLTGPKFKQLYKLLSETGRCKFYGINANEDVIEQGYIGRVPFDGTTVIEILQQHGIVLVLHSEIHNRNKIPSSRIFEAAAASTVIICDQNEFVKEHFKDSAFYIDTRLSAEKVFEQIQGHLNTILMDPEKALVMAKKAHDIFIENFEMADQLHRLERLHNKVIANYE